MTTPAKDRTRPLASNRPDRTVVYRGIKIAPMPGRRSSLARAIRKDLEEKSERPHGAPAQA
ncbi:MAG: hypothetical protein ACK4JY_07970 [Brevundimonas sp.]|uniref:hypothetical protein n=1 Tax=Brevundimonas sp. TaxID=1871086 RepID=UPI00391DA757